jgi:multidrug efflux system membrane fusion protein
MKLLSPSPLLPIALVPWPWWRALRAPGAAPEPVRAVRTMGWQPGGRRQPRVCRRGAARTESRLGFRVAGKLIAAPNSASRSRPARCWRRLDATDLQLGSRLRRRRSAPRRRAYDLAQAEFKRYQELRARASSARWSWSAARPRCRRRRLNWSRRKRRPACRAIRRPTPRCTATDRRRHDGGGSRSGCGAGRRRAGVRLAHDGPRDAVFAVPEDGVAACAPAAGPPGCRAGAALGRDRAAGHGARGGRGCRPEHAHLPGQGRPGHRRCNWARPPR